MTDFGSWFDALRPWRDTDFADSQNALVLSAKLWGSPENLRRQLLASSPQVPDGLDTQGLRTLLGVALVSCRFEDQMLTPGIPKGTRIIVGARSFTVHQARHEIVWRALDALGLA